MPSGRVLPSLRTELFLSLATVVVAALLFAIPGVLLVGNVGDNPYGAFALAAYLVAEITICFAYGAYLVRRSVLRPLSEVVVATEAIAGGDLQRRVVGGDTREFAALAASVNRMTDILVQERAHLIRAEKLAGVGRLAAGIAHEIGNPLSAISGYTHLLRGRCRDTPDTGHALTGLERETDRIDRIVRGLLDYSRPRPSSETSVSVPAVIRSVVHLLTDQRTLGDVEVVLEVGDDDERITGNAQEIEQVFVNLLLNAVHALDGRGRITISSQLVTADTLAETAPTRRAGESGVSIARRRPHRPYTWLPAGSGAARFVKVVVADSGPGISPEQAELIFDPFVTTKPPGEGTGLGLAIVARIMDNHQGAVWVAKAREGGAAFHLLLPITAEPDGSPSPRPTRTPTA